MSKQKQPIAIYYEHPHWFVPLFKELDRRGVPYVRIDAAQHHFDPAHLNGEGGYSLVFNRMSPSAYRRGHGQGIFYTLYYLDHLEQRGKRIVNGQKAFRYETSKALQLSLLETLKLPYRGKAEYRRQRRRRNQIQLAGRVGRRRKGRHA